jgi:hypothetical protein
LTEDLPWGVVPKPAFVREDARGLFEEVLNIGRWESLIAGTMHAGAVLGHHYHAHTIVFFYLQEGRSRVVTVDTQTGERREAQIRARQGFLFRPAEARAITHLEPVRFIILKSHRFDSAAPDLIQYQVS